MSSLKELEARIRSRADRLARVGDHAERGRADGLVEACDEYHEVREAMRAEVETWRKEANEKCEDCANDWPLGKHGCHFEPRPVDYPSEDEWYGAEGRCKAFGLRKRIERILRFIEGEPQ